MPKTKSQLNDAGMRESVPSKTLDVDATKTFKNLQDTIETQLSKSAAAKQKRKRSQINGMSDSLSDATRGKKRDRDGRVLQSNGVEASEAQDHGEGEEFEREVRALGGTSEDVQLLADAESDSEVEGLEVGQAPSSLKGKKSPDLAKGINNILKEISLAQGKQEVSSDLDESKASSPEPALVQVAQPQQATKQKKGKSRLKVEPRPDWFTLTDAVGAAESGREERASTLSLKQLQEHGESLLREENDLYKQEHQSGSGQSFYNTVIASGTLSDKISALTLAAQESPLHNMKALETLIALSKKRSRAQAVDVLRALKDLFAQGCLLPGSRRLYSFATQPAAVRAFAKRKSWTVGDKLPKGVEEQHIIVWAFESWLKEQYFEILKTLEVWCNDEIEFAKSRAISYVYELLKEKPEQESNLLRLLVNKLGDPIKKIASQASYLLMQLLHVHPAMKSIIVSAIETDFIFRPGQSMHGKYYGAITLNQTALSSQDEELAIKLLDIYFGLFSALLKTADIDQGQFTGQKSFTRRERQKGKKEPASGQAQTDELREKLTSAILTGVNRAYPYAGPDSKSFADHLNALFKIVHSTNFNTSIQAMLLIQQLSTSHQPSSDRFYRVLYESLLDPRLIMASKQQLYLNLLHRSLKADMNIRRVKAFVKRLLQILSLHEPAFICGAFFLLKDLDSSFPALSALIDQSEEGEDEEEVFRDVDEDNKAPQPSNNSALKTLNIYDAHKRAPEHANADNSCAWEILPFLAHFHPSVLVSVEHYIKHKKLPGKPDLTLHTLIHFLDRFVYKNAKLSDMKMHGASIMQPMASDNTRAVLLNPTLGGKQRMAVNTEEFRAKHVDDVAAEDVFFHQYFQTLGKDTSKKAKKGKKRANAEDESVGSDDEDAVWDAMMKSAPELEADESDEEGLSMSDLESEMDGDDSDDAVEDVQSDSSGVDVEAGIFDESDDEMADIGGVDKVADFEDLKSDDDMLDEDEEALPRQMKAEKSNKNKDKRKKLKGLPTFASMEDYAKMIEDDEDEDIG